MMDVGEAEEARLAMGRGDPAAVGGRQDAGAGRASPAPTGGNCNG